MDYYISIIATTRNDNHGGDLLTRTTAFVEGIYEQSRKWNLSIELIIVEWNPPKAKPLLKDALPAPDSNTLVSLKYIIVPEEIHNTYITGAKIPLYQMIAKNVGIRRAKGEFILCTNIDILFTDNVFKIIKEKKISEGLYYRTNRCDIPNDVLKIEKLSDRLQYSEKNIIRKLGKGNGRETLHLPAFIRKHKRLSILLNEITYKVWIFLYPNRFPHFRIDFEACGDFTLMSKKDWMDIEGYVELDMYSIHIDSMALWAANALGKEQVVLPDNAPIYHIYHEDGWESHDPLKTIKFLEGKPCLDYSIVFKAGMEIVKRKQHWQMNKPDWGFANEKFKEYIFAPGKNMEEIN